MRAEKVAALERWLRSAAAAAYPELTDAAPDLELPRDPAHGDLASSLGLRAARRLKRPPLEVAARIAGALPPPAELVEPVEIKSPGFINFRWSTGCVREELAHILSVGESYGRWSGPARGRVQLEFVSANPTGPLNVVSARASAVGDSLARLFRLCGYQVETEYYVNDTGTQVAGLGESVRAFFVEQTGGEPAPADLPYRGSYVGEIAGEAVELAGLVARAEGTAGSLAGAPAAAAETSAGLVERLRALLAGEEAAAPAHRALARCVVALYAEPGAAPAPALLREALGHLLERGGGAGEAPPARLRETVEAWRSELDFGAFGVAANVAEQERDLTAFGVRFDAATGRGPGGWFRESWLHREGLISATEAAYERGGLLREEDGARWLVTSRWGDSEDRVVRRRTGESTYFLADLAYHLDKRRRGYDRVIDIWGPDHHGHVARMQAGLLMQGIPEDWLTVLIAQQVNLLRDGQPVKMSKRAGEFVTLRDLVEEVGRDAARFFFLMRRTSSPLDFDLAVATRDSEENPIYYVQYAYARIRSIFQLAEERGMTAGAPAGAPLDLLAEPEELELMKRLGRFPEVAESCVRVLDPQGMGLYLRELAQNFHRYYQKHRVLVDEADLRAARFALIRAVRTVLGNGLRAIGVEPPQERM